VADRVFRAAASSRQRMGPAAFTRSAVLASRLVCGLHWVAVLCSRRQWTAHASVVRAHRSSFCARPVFPFFRKQSRKLSRAHLLSDSGWAVPATWRADMAVDSRLLCPDSVDRALRRADAAIGQLVAGCRYGSRSANRVAHMA